MPSLSTSSTITFMSARIRGKDNRLLLPLHSSDPRPRDGPMVCKKRLGGLLKFYYKEAA